MVQKLVVCIAAVLVAAALPCYADFAAGLAAYDHGDYGTAAKEWQPIAERGDANAQYNMGLLFARGKGAPLDYQRSAEWYRKAADQGVAAAQYNLGVLYLNGQGVPQNKAEARQWFEKAADAGLPEGAVALGDLNYEAEKFPDAEKWYRRAAERGIASAQFQLGVIYDLGQGVPQDYQQASDWYTKAAEAGYAAAMTNLGILYYNAQGEKRDLVLSYAWLARGQKFKDPRAAQLLRTTAERMNQKDVRRGQELAEQWQPSGKPEQKIEDAKLFLRPEMRPAQGSSDREAPPPAPLPLSASPVSLSRGSGNRETPSAAPAVAGPGVWTGVDRVIAVGDVHGDYEQFVKILQSADLIDAGGNWIGGRAHLVQTGNLVGRGPDSRALIDLLMKLEKQAAAAGGAVHALIGNQEALDVRGDTRYVSPAEFSAFRAEASRQYAYDADKQRMATVSALQGDPQASLQGDPQASLEDLAEWRAAFGPEGVHGRWIRMHDTVIKIDRTLFVHAGIGTKYADWTLDKINTEVREEMNDGTDGPATDEQGPLWARELAEGDEKSLAAFVDGLLTHFGVDRIVIGHSYAGGAVTPRFLGKVILIDVGLSRIFDNRPQLACLEIDQNHAYALHRGHGIELPADEDGPDMRRYLRQAAALDPQPSPLAARMQELAAGGRWTLTAVPVKAEAGGR